MITVTAREFVNMEKFKVNQYLFLSLGDAESDYYQKQNEHEDDINEED